MKQYLKHVSIFLSGILALASAYGQPVADFQATTVTGCAPIIISFQDMSVGAVSWEWSTGVGQSNLQHPAVFYTQPGVYSVTLIVTDAQGQKDTLVRTNYITAHDNPIADFSIADPFVCAHEAVQFQDNSFPGIGGTLQYSWDFGDGQSGTMVNPQHTYTQPGTYPVSLVVRNQFGCTDNKVIQAAVTVSAPDVSFTASQVVACGPPLIATFTPGSPLGNHTWFFGDGSSSTQVQPTHQYTTTGSFTVTHIVTSSQGCSDTLVRPAFINLGVNTLGISAEDSSVCQGDTVFFLTSAPSNATVIWDFGDGVTTLQHQPFYIYQNHGTYQVTAQISDPSGCTFNMGFPVTIHPKPTVAYTTVGSPIGCSLPFTVQFINQSVNATSWEWRFGDGTTSSLQHPTHTYTQEGNFDIRLAAFGPGGCSMAVGFKNAIEVKEVKAAFKADNRSGCAPLTVAFSDTSASLFPTTGWHWDFGDGTTSTLQSPVHTYNLPGKYTVRLIVSNAQGCTDTLIRTDYVQAGQKPTVNFAPDTNQACALAPVSFTNLSTGATSFIWMFGDGDTAMTQHAIHGFAALGPMNVMLIGADRGCADTMFMAGAVNVLAPLPIIGITEKKVCNLPSTVGFFNLSIGADTWAWSLNDSIPMPGQHPTYTFTQAGNYSVGLTVTNIQTGCSVTAYDMVQVLPVEANFTVTPDEGCAPHIAMFTNTSLNATKSWWHFGLAPKDTSIVKSPVFSYANAGNYNVTLIVTNALKCRDTLLVQNAVKAHSIRAEFTANTPKAGCIPLPVDFRDLSTSTSQAVSWLWDFGDGTTSTLQHPTHIYQSVGQYPVKLTVVDANGCTHTLTKNNFVHATFPVADFVVTSKVNCPDQNITFVSNSNGSGLSYQWDFGDGTTSTFANPAHSYTQSGTYTIRLRVQDVNGCTDSITRVNYISVQPLVAAFVADTVHAPCPPLPVHFTSDTSFLHPGATYSWTFGNGASSSQQHPFHQYTQPGLYDVQLILTSPSGCRDTASVPQMIHVEGPVATFTFDPSEGCPGSVFSFEAQSDVVITYQWYFGDGGTALGPQASYAYPNSGYYQPALLVEDSSGCKVFTVSPDSIEIFPVPEPSFTANKTLLCESGDIQFTNLTQTGGQNLTWSWNFGDGNSSSVMHPVHTYTQPGTYTVTLRLTTAEGCSDSLIQTGFIRVVNNPNPELIVSDTSGCVPFGVTFQAKVNGHTSNISTYQWDFGDSGAQGNGVQVSYVYQLGNTYLTSLSVTDENGCTGTANQLLEAWSLPNGSFIVSDTVGCAPAAITFTANVPQAVSWQWTFGDGQVSGANPAVHTYTSDGIYDVSLEVTDSNGCRAALTKPNHIRLRHPEARFAALPEVCPGQPVTFTHQSTFEQGLSVIKWIFDDGTEISGHNAVRSFSQAGPQGVTLYIEDGIQCGDSLRIDPAITVKTSVQPDPIDVLYATVTSSSTVELAFMPHQSPWNDFDHYVVYRKNPAGQFDSLASISRQFESGYMDTGASPESGPMCYRVVTVNYCGLRSDLATAETHCTIDVDPQPLTDAVLVEWTAYQGFTPDAYRVYRVDGYTGSRQLVGMVPGNETVFLDDRTFCYESYTYRIEATGTQRSLSDIATQQPNHEGPALASHVVRATVEGNAQVLVEWDMPEIDRPQSLVLERNEGSGFRTVSQTPYQPGADKYSDVAVEVGATSYVYRAFLMDSCGDVTPLGRSGKTILLLADQTGGAIELMWTPYEGWENGVDYYEVEFFDEAEQRFVKIGETTQPGYVDSENRNAESENCYRVTAFEQGGNQTFSFSNEACLVPEPTLFAANAFTPNGDGINDRFMVQGAYLDQAEMIVYNRWGELIFHTSQPFNGWDGITDKGMQVPEGVYMYVLSGTGDNGQSVKLVGSITVIR